MTITPRLFLGTLVALALTAPALAAAASPAPAPATSAASPSVAYKKIVKDCHTYEMDGQEQKQCHADFTVAVADIKKNYKIVLTARDPNVDATFIIGKFTSDGASARKRFHDVVVSWGDPDDQTKMRFRVVVKNASGEKVFASQPRTF